LNNSATVGKGAGEPAVDGGAPIVFSTAVDGELRGCVGAAQEADLEVTSVTQLEKDTILICHQNCAKVVSLSGKMKTVAKHSQRVPMLKFDHNIDAIQCIDDVVLAFYKHGFQGRSFVRNEVVQNVFDDQHIYRLLGFSGLNPVLERRRTDDPMAECSDLLMVVGHTT